ncbi:hypothetical protein D3C85_1509220 [compost metagenome]
MCRELSQAHCAARGCLNSAQELLEENGIAPVLHDERFLGEPIYIRFAGTLRSDQETAPEAVLEHDTGILCAPTAFGKP